jgi:outer membrane lipoprotein carrier protein
MAHGSWLRRVRVRSNGILDIPAGGERPLTFICISCARVWAGVKLRRGKPKLKSRSGCWVLLSWLLSCWLGSVTLSIPVQAQDIHLLARAVDDHYNRLRSLEAGFTETYKGSGVERVESGTLWLKKPRKMRWEYRSPKEKLFVSDGQSVWFYLPTERQLRKTEFRKLDDLRSPIAFLLGKTKLENELQGLSKAIDQTPASSGNIVLRGVPKAMTGQVSEVQVEIAPSNQIVRIVLMEADGGTTEFRFADWKENQELNDGLFHFTPPAGVEIVEGALAP